MPRGGRGVQVCGGGGPSHQSGAHGSVLLHAHESTATQQMCEGGRCHGGRFHGNLPKGWRYGAEVFQVTGGLLLLCRPPVPPASHSPKHGLAGTRMRSGSGAATHAYHYGYVWGGVQWNWAARCGAQVFWGCSLSSTQPLLLRIAPPPLPRAPLGCRCTWPGWSRDAFREWRSYIRMALPSCVMICKYDDICTMHEINAYLLQ